ncbi:hypothetical protein RA268_27830 [Pseudomonas syringae pv. tagetis]
MGWVVCWVCWCGCFLVGGWWVCCCCCCVVVVFSWLVLLLGGVGDAMKVGGGVGCWGLWGVCGGGVGCCC